jgi:exoribonuclease-2
VKLLGPGEYVVQKPGEQSAGHFGLAVHRYTHSTAPNRRYPDLITQRLLKSATAMGGKSYSAEELSKIADHCNERESAARKVERKMRKVAAAMLHEKSHRRSIRRNRHRRWPKRHFRPRAETTCRWNGSQTRERPKVGQKVRVKLLSADPERGFIDFAAI